MKHIVRWCRARGYAVVCTAKFREYRSICYTCAYRQFKTERSSVRTYARVLGRVPNLIFTRVRLLLYLQGFFNS